MTYKWHMLEWKKRYTLQISVETALSQFSQFVSRISNFFGPSTTDETSLVEMRIWCIKIGIVLLLHRVPSVLFSMHFKTTFHAFS
jgi:hypothetical protein